MMKILISNDDGYFAPGLAALVEALRPLGHLTVIAPEQNRSGASNSLTLDRPLIVREAPNGFLYVNGTPSDCVHLAVTGMLGERQIDMPDLVVAGINNGANMGDDTLYSGTVAAATEGFLCGVPAIAFSLASRSLEHVATAAQVAHDLVQRLSAKALPKTMLLNVNVPNIAHSALKGMQTSSAVLLGVQRRDAHLVFTVSDDGPGLGTAQGEAAHQALNTGLGTELCRAVARAHRHGQQMGRVELFNRPDGGAQFELWKHTELTIDVVPGRGAGFSVESPHGVRFLTRSRVFTIEELGVLEANGPPSTGPREL